MCPGGIAEAEIGCFKAGKLDLIVIGEEALLRAVGDTHVVPVGVVVVRAAIERPVTGRRERSGVQDRRSVVTVEQLHRGISEGSTSVVAYEAPEGYGCHYAPLPKRLRS